MKRAASTASTWGIEVQVQAIKTVKRFAKIQFIVVRANRKLGEISQIDVAIAIEIPVRPPAALRAVVGQDCHGNKGPGVDRRGCRVPSRSSRGYDEGECVQRAAPALIGPHVRAGQVDGLQHPRAGEVQTTQARAARRPIRPRHLNPARQRIGLEAPSVVIIERQLNAATAKQEMSLPPGVTPARSNVVRYSKTMFATGPGIGAGSLSIRSESPVTRK
jgi:hypothetical protein